MTALTGKCGATIDNITILVSLLTSGLQYDALAPRMYGCSIISSAVISAHHSSLHDLHFRNSLNAPRGSDGLIITIESTKALPRAARRALNRRTPSSVIFFLCVNSDKEWLDAMRSRSKNFGSLNPQSWTPQWHTAPRLSAAYTASQAACGLSPKWTVVLFLKPVASSMASS